LTGTIPPGSQLDYSHTTVTFTAYSHITHSTSHATLVISYSASNAGPGGTKHGHPTSLSVAARKRLVLGLSITFGAIGGLLLLTALLAIFRRCARVRDTALIGEEGTHAWTAEERKWYGIGVDVEKSARDVGRGQGWAKHSGGSDVSEKGSLEEGRLTANENPFESELERQVPPSGTYGHLGLGLRRVSPRSPSGQPPTSRSGVMSKGEFVGKVRQTARKVSNKVRMVSDKYTRMRARRIRPPIGRPVLVTRTGMDANGLTVNRVPLNTHDGPSYNYAANPFGDFDGSRGTSLTDSPTSSSGGRSIPVRRADFASPKTARPQRPSLARIQAHRASAGSLATHAGEATLHTASRATSVRSVNSASGISYQAKLETTRFPAERPRVVQFTSSTRVPIPKLPSEQLNLLAKGQTAPATGQSKRIASQTAAVFNTSEVRRQGSLDGLNLGMHYVNTLGENLSDVVFPAARGKENATKIVVTAGEEFRFRVNVAIQTGAYRPLEARLASGGPLPDFLQLDLMSHGGDGTLRKAVEFYGIPNSNEVGEYSVAVYATDNMEPVAKVIVRVKSRGGS
jgi:axial budding pattern protein 2